MNTQDLIKQSLDHIDRIEERNQRLYEISAKHIPFGSKDWLTATELNEEDDLEVIKTILGGENL